MSSHDSVNALDQLARRVQAAATRAGRSDSITLLAVSKTRGADEIRALAAAGQHAFGENYVQEALHKQSALTDLGIEWHLIGPLQSNKCREAATAFDWVQSIDRPKLLPLLERFRADDRAPLNLLIQVNIDHEASKAGCAPDQIAELARLIDASPRLRLRGLMAIPAASADPARQHHSFARMQQLFAGLQADYPGVDTLSMGMSEDFEQAIACGATMVRVGTALFGPRTT